MQRGITNTILYLILNGRYKWTSEAQEGNTEGRTELRQAVKKDTVWMEGEVFLFVFLARVWLINTCQCPPNTNTTTTTTNPTNSPRALQFKFWQIFYVGTPSQEKWGRDRKEDERGGERGRRAIFIYRHISTRILQTGRMIALFEIYIIQYKILKIKIKIWYSHKRSRSSSF